MKRTDTESFASEYCMSAGDNALGRERIDAAIISKATANEHSFREACMAGLKDVAGTDGRKKAPAAALPAAGPPGGGEDGPAPGGDDDGDGKQQAAGADEDHFDAD